MLLVMDLFLVKVRVLLYWKNMNMQKLVVQKFIVKLVVVECHLMHIT